MEISIANRLDPVKPSATLALMAEVARLRARGEDIVSLEGGEPDYDTPEIGKRAALSAMNAGFTKYTAVDGIHSLKEAIAERCDQDYGLRYEPGELLVSCGAKHVFYNLCQALLNPGDEVLIPAPYWVSYPDIALLAGARPSFIRAGVDQSYKITAAQLDAAISEKTRLFVLNSPSNPTGIAYGKEELAALGKVLKKHPHVVIATDGVYDRINLTGQPIHHLVSVCPWLKQRTVLINGVSKAYAMTGWRIGYAAGPGVLISAMKKVQSQSTSNPTSIAQHAAEAVLRGEQSRLGVMIDSFRARRDYVVGSLNAMNGVNCLSPNGAFYVFPDVSEAIRNLDLEDDLAFAKLLLQRVGVAVVPGTAFGGPGSVRLSFAVSMGELEKAMNRMGGFLGWVAAPEVA